MKIYDLLVRIAKPVVFGTILCVAGSVVNEGKIKSPEEKAYFFPVGVGMPAPDHVHQSSPGIVYTMDKEFATIPTSIASPFSI